MAQTNIVTLFLRGNATSLITAMTSAETKVSRAVTGMAKAFATVGPAAALAFGQVVKRGSEVERTATSFERLTAAVGLSGDAMIKATREGTKGLIADIDIMAAANKGLLLGLPITEQGMGDMATAAATLGQAMGQGATKSLDDLIIALGRSSPMILDNLGLTVKVGEANAVYAAQLGKSTTQLTEVEKKQAFFNAAMDAAREKTAQLGGVQVTAVDKTTQLTNRFQNWFDTIARGTASLGPIAGGLGLIADKAGSAGFALAGMGPIITGMGGWSAVMGAVGTAAKAMWLAVTGPVGLVVAGLVAVGTAAYIFRDDIKAAFGIAAEAAEEWSVRTGDALVDANPRFLKAIAEANKATADWFVALEKVASVKKATGGADDTRYLDQVKREADAALENAQALSAVAEGISKEVKETRASIAAKKEKEKATKKATEADKKAAAAAEKEAASIAVLTRAMLGLPTLKAVEDARLLRAAWAGMSVEERTLIENSNRLGEALSKLQGQSVALTAQEARLASIYRLWAGIADIKVEMPEFDWDKGFDGAEEFGRKVPDHIVAGIGGGALQAGEKAGGDFISALGKIDVGGTLARAFEGAAGFMGALKSLASQVASVFLDALGGWLNKGLGGILKGLFGGGGGGGAAISSAFGGAGKSAGASLLGGLFGGAAGGGGAAAAGAASVSVGGATFGGAAGAGGGLLGGLGSGFLSVAAAIPGWGWAAAGIAVAGILVAKVFKKPNKLEIAGRKAAAEARTAIADTLTDGQVVEAAGNMANGVHIAIRDAMLGAGASIAEAEAEAHRLVEALWLAEKEGPEAVAAAMESIQEIITASGAAAAAALAEMVQGVSSVWDRAKEAGTDAYNKIYEEAIRSGDGQEEAAAKAADAQVAATAAVLEAEGQKYIRIAAFEAALEAIRSGNAAGAVEAARKAAKETSEAWDTAVGVVGEAWAATETAVGDSSGKITETVEEDAEAATEAVETQLATIEEEYASMAGKLKEETGDLNQVLDEVFRDRSFSVTQHLLTEGSHEGSPIHAEEKQHGGPVLAGRPYIVGERRPELFVPSQSGTIVPRVGGRNQRPIEITLVNKLGLRTLSKELIRVEEKTLDFYGY